MQLKIGILSAAQISNDFVLSLNSLNKDHYKVVAVAATKLESAKKFAEKLKIPKAYGNYHELAKDTEVDVVYIGARNQHHYAAAKLMIEHKKHVLVEKPMTIEVETTKELFELGKKHNVFVMEALWSRFVPGYKKIREAINSGQIGDLVHVQSNFVMSTTKDRLVLKKFGGGSLLDIGIYGLNAIFEGVNYTKPKDMKAFGKLYSEGEADVTVSATIDFPNQVTATMLLTAEAGKVNLERLNHVIYIGTKGYIKFNGFIMNPQKIEINGQIISTSTDDGQAGYISDLGSSAHGLRFQIEEVRKCLMEKRLTSSIHGSEKSILLAETISKLMDDLGYDIKGATVRDTEFKYV